MQTFEYKGYDESGQAARGLIEADNVKSAREMLARQGILAERVAGTARHVRLAVAARADVYRGLSALLRAGVPMLGALEILADSPEQREARLVLSAMRDGVRDGASLAEALAAACHSVSSFERSIIDAAEASASVEVMLDRLAAFLEQQDQVRERVHGALTYPAIVMAVGVCVAILMLGLLLPRTAEILGGRGERMPGLTVGMLALGAFIKRWWLALVVVLGAAGWGARLTWGRRAGLRLWVDRLRFSLPVVGRGFRLLATLRFARTLAILLRGGVSPVTGLGLAGRATGSVWIVALADAEADRVRHGSSLSEAVRRIPPLSDSLAGWVRVGEAGGDLERLLDGAGQRAEAQWDRFLGRCLSVLEPLLILFIGGFVLLVTLAVLLPVLSLSRTIGH